MKKSQQRVTLREEQDKVLGAEVGLTGKPIKDKRLPKQLPPLFLRWPRGITNVPEEKPRNNLLYVYVQPKQKANPRAPQPPNTPQAQAPVFLECLLAFGTLDWKENEFLFEVAKNSLVGAGPSSGKYPAATWQAVNRQAGPPLRFLRMPAFDATRTADGAQLRCSVSVWKGKTGYIAVVYVWEKSKEGAAAKTVEISLATFAAEDEAGKALQEFQNGAPLGPVPTMPPQPPTPE
jgi:hypothetical protein